jgi:RNA polymerase sigma-70 factor (ECF subfamily)
MDLPGAGQARGKVLVWDLPSAPGFRAVFDAHYAYVCSSLRRLGVGDRDREDAAIEVFLRVHARLVEYDIRRPIRPWLFAFAARVASEFRRSARRRPPLVHGDILIDVPAPAEPDKFDVADARGLVAAALDTLDDDKREVFVLHDLDECSVPDIAAALGLPEGTVYTRLRAARARFGQAVRRLRARERTP